ncbi:MAG: hypothetical protein IKQ14_08040 [Candidatus Methanomethylophilaceae archaeon]|nr:hypothetical protein [Candidatus Methanomethylophilaceae archaeon]MBR6213311.1 hypothetical protein [Candidatus Methanomethylophilaceae archaeon]
MNAGILVLMLLLSQAVLAEFTSEDNGISYEYCTVGCDAVSLSLYDGNLSFGYDSSCIISYDDSEGRNGEMTLSFSGDIPDGTHLTLSCRTDGSQFSAEGFFIGGSCFVVIEDVRSGADIEISGTASSTEPASLILAIIASGSDGYRSFLTIC